MYYLFLIASILGFALLGSSTLIGVGSALYHWGVLSVPLGLAAWTGFKYFLYSLVSGLILFVIGKVGTHYAE